MKQRASEAANRASNVFLNVPYDKQFQSLWLAYIAGVYAFGLVPRATLEIPGGVRRLDRILDIIHECDYSVHDLSRVQLDRRAPRTPRFNMPFELGLTIAWQHSSNRSHVWFVCESRNYRVFKSLSDLNGTDVYIHNGRVRGVFAQLGNAFVRVGRKPSVSQMERIYRALSQELPAILKNSGSPTPFEARPFSDLCYVANAAADAVMLGR
jgi:hypothetical protein